MNFREYLILKEAESKDKKPSGKDPKATAEWWKFSKNFKIFVHYIGPTRLEKLLYALFKNNSVDIESVIMIDDPSGREGGNAPKIEQRNNNFFIKDSVNQINKKSNLNEGVMDVLTFVVGSIGASIKDSIKKTLGAFAKEFIGKYTENFKMNPKSEEDKKENEKQAKLNNTFKQEEIRNLKYAIWTKDLITKLENGSIKNTDPRITWVKTCSKIPFDSVRPIGKSCLNTVVPWQDNRNPPFDVALQYVCKNYGVRMLINILKS